MSDTFEAYLIECLDALDQGAELEALLAHYPEDAAELRRALRAAGALSAFDVTPSPDAQEESRRKFLAAGVAMSAQSQPRKALSMRFGALVLRGAAILVAVIGAGAIPVAASENALPGDPLYGVKRGVEELQLGLASDLTAREVIATRNNARRIEEVDALLHLRRDAQTGFEGRVEEATPESLTVSGVTMVVPPGFNLPELGTGALVQVTVQVQNGQLILVEIHLVEQGEVIVPTPTPIPTPVPTHTPAPSPTHEDSSGQGGIAPTDDDPDDETPDGDDGGEIEPTEDEGTDDGGGDDGGEAEPTEDEGDDDSGGDDSGSGGGDDGGDDDSGGNSGSGGGGGDDD